MDNIVDKTTASSLFYVPFPSFQHSSFISPVSPSRSTLFPALKLHFLSSVIKPFQPLLGFLT